MEKQKTVTEGGGEKKQKKKRSEWSKYSNMAFRVSHVWVSGLIMGGLYWQVDFSRLWLWHQLTIVTGILLIVSGVIQSRHWPYQGRGVLAGVHIVLLWLIHHLPQETVPILATVLVTGVVGSHLPGNIRHYSLLHRRRMD